MVSKNPSSKQKPVKGKKKQKNKQENEEEKKIEEVILPPIEITVREVERVEFPPPWTPRSKSQLVKQKKESTNKEKSCEEVKEKCPQTIQLRVGDMIAPNEQQMMHNKYYSSDEQNFNLSYRPHQIEAIN